MVDAAGGGAEGEGAGPVQTSAAGAGPVHSSALDRRPQRGTGTRGLLPPPPPHPSAARSEVGVLRSWWRGIGRERDTQK